MDARKLKAHAAEAAAKGKHKKALEGYLELERREPKDGGWSRRAGEMYRQLGRVDEGIAAFQRAANKYADSGFVAKASAVCQTILRMRPDDADARARLEQLLPAGSRPRTTRPSSRPQSVSDLTREELGSGARPADAGPAPDPAPRGKAGPAPDPAPRGKAGPAPDPAPRVKAGGSAPPPIPGAGGRSGDGERAAPSAPAASRPAGPEASGVDPEALDELDADLVEEIEDFEEDGGTDAEGDLRALWAAEGGTGAEGEAAAPADAPDRAADRAAGGGAEALELGGDAGLEAVEIDTDAGGGDLGARALDVPEGDDAVQIDGGAGEGGLELETEGEEEGDEALEIEAEPADDLGEEGFDFAAAAPDEGDKPPDSIAPEPKQKERAAPAVDRDEVIREVLAASPLFAPFDESEARALVERFDLLEVEAGETLVVAGELAERLIVSARGELVLSREGGEESAPAGTVLGQTSLLSREPEPVTARAKTSCVALVLPDATFRELIMTHPMLLAQLAGS